MLGIGKPMQWIEGGAGVLAGVVGARAIPQMLFSSTNTGVMGYVMNAGATIALGVASHMMFPRNPTITASVVAGGFAATLARIISDQTPFGAQLSLTGLGDWGLGLYKKSNYPYPPQLQNGMLRGPGNANFTWGDGSQASVPTYSNVGADSSAPC